MQDSCVTPAAPAPTLVPSNHQYERLEKLGEGAYGIVYKGRHRLTGETVALKRIRFDEQDDGIPTTALREITVLQKIHSKHVVRLNEIIYEGEKAEDTRLCLVFEFLAQDLKMYMDSIGSEGMHPKIFKSFSHQLLSGLAEVHSHAVLHRDLKPQNLLINARGELKIADFGKRARHFAHAFFIANIPLGLARGFKTPNQMYTHEIVTLWYRAPCILLGCQQYSTGVDVWAAACIIAEMNNLQALFAGDSEIDQLFKIFRGLGTPSEDAWQGVSELKDYNASFPKWPRKRLALPRLCADGNDMLNGMLHYAPHRRLTARQALHHAFFTK